MTKTTIILGAVAVVAAGTAVSKFIASRRGRERVTTPANAANDDAESTVGVIDVVPEDVEPDIPRLDDD